KKWQTSELLNQKKPVGFFNRYDLNYPLDKKKSNRHVDISFKRIKKVRKKLFKYLEKNYQLEFKQKFFKRKKHPLVSKNDIQLKQIRKMVFDQVYTHYYDTKFIKQLKSKVKSKKNELESKDILNKDIQFIEEK